MARLAAFAMTRERVRNVAFRTISQIGIRYRHSPLSQTATDLPQGAPVAGDRFPWMKLQFEANGPVEDLFQKLDDTRFNLLVAGQPLPASNSLDAGDRLGTYVIPDEPANQSELARVNIRGPVFYLLRPDGHVGLCGTHVDMPAIAGYFARHMGLHTQSRGAGAREIRRVA